MLLQKQSFECESFEREMVEVQQHLRCYSDKLAERFWQHANATTHIFAGSHKRDQNHSVPQTRSRNANVRQSDNGPHAWYKEMPLLSFSGSVRDDSDPCTGARGIDGGE
jgi:hypothetical protein